MDKLYRHYNPREVQEQREAKLRENVQAHNVTQKDWASYIQFMRKPEGRPPPSQAETDAINALSSILALDGPPVMPQQGLPDNRLATYSNQVGIGYL